LIYITYITLQKDNFAEVFKNLAKYQSENNSAKQTK